MSEIKAHPLWLIRGDFFDQPARLFLRQTAGFHIPVDDPSDVQGSEEEIMKAFRAARDQIKEMVEGFLKWI